MPYRISSSGSQDDRPFYLYAYSFALNRAKTVQSLTLPKNRNVIVLAATLTTPGKAEAAGELTSRMFLAKATSTPMD
jgi:hypothetical protein